MAQQDRGIIGDTWGTMSHLERFGAEAAVAGVAYMGYEQWRKHHTKPHSAQSEQEYAQYTSGYNQQQQAPANPNQQASWLNPAGNASQPPQPQLPPGWEVQYSQQYETNFYHNIHTGASQWEFPESAPASFSGPPPQMFEPQHPTEAPSPSLLQQTGNTWGNMSHLQRFGAEAGVAGAGYLAYEAWLKHNNKGHSEHAQREYENYSRGL
ncbi:hypothetical protein BC830DRAFT_1086796 [Chytriomyces sp. MP71]|nr:hypothetical protein BC830DRAFT_1086796 [Chytriomyces sp. MP71]